MTPFIGELATFGFNFAPTGWAMCQGQLLSIQQNTALFSILGTTFGGNGTTNFGLPNLQALVPIGPGQGPGLSPFVPGETGGETAVTLATIQMPAHTHSPPALPVTSVNTTPQNGSMLSEGQGGGRGQTYTVNTYTTNGPGTTLRPAAVSPAGGNQPHTNMQPSLTINWCIALTGTFPVRP
jgi:microcystin-dependent protein